MSSYRHAPLSTGQYYRDPPGFLDRLYDGARHVYQDYISDLLANAQGDNRRSPHRKGPTLHPRSLLGLPTALILIWMIVLWLGEVGTFRSKVKACGWQYWEKWPDSATPHHLVLIADPQLVDPHTYPGRPWPLSTITRRHTDYYMRKSFTLLQDRLDPKTAFFLGDLFDGGREWLPPGVSGSDPRWRNYGEDYWVKEYRRFGNIFFNEWVRRRESDGQDTYHRRKILAGLPGNHDLGLGNGIKLPVRNRFNAFFGEGNHIDVTGNHTFVSLDTVSLSAKGQTDPATGRQGAGGGEGSSREISGPVEEFLNNMETDKPRIINRAVRTQNARVENDLMFHEVLDINSTLITKSVHSAYTSKVYMPSVLLTHVPLYRAAGTPCGPLRERFPPTTKPSEGGEYLEKDPDNAIKVQAGIQYQNVLTPEISAEIIDKIGDVEYAFSGDDHDYCEVVHRGYTSRRGGIREITVKSFSWAMGVRKPGFLLLSLWNPLEEKDRKASSYPSKSRGEPEQHQTIQTHLCLLPDQLAIFIRYGIFSGITLLLLFIRAVKDTRNSGNRHTTPYTNGHVLPLSTKAKAEPPPSYNSSVVSSHHTQSNGLAARPTAGRTRTASPMKGYGYPGTNNTASLHDDPLDERWSSLRIDDDRSKRRAGGFGERIRVVGLEFRRNVLVVGVPVGVWYFYLVRSY
ncbi:MAG: hypothetical protein Q9201_006114 [Fulgogasparrea decipioides]